MQSLSVKFTSNKAAADWKPKTCFKFLKTKVNGKVFELQGEFDQSLISSRGQSSIQTRNGNPFIISAQLSIAED